MYIILRHKYEIYVSILPTTVFFLNIVTSHRLETTMGRRRMWTDAFQTLWLRTAAMTLHALLNVENVCNVPPLSRRDYY